MTDFCDMRLSFDAITERTQAEKPPAVPVGEWIAAIGVFLIVPIVICLAIVWHAASLGVVL